MEEEHPEAGGKPTEPAAEEGANQVPLPVTPADWLGKRLDEHLDDVLGIDANRLPVQSSLSNERGRSRSPASVARGGAEEGAWQNRKEKQGEQRRRSKLCFAEWIVMEHGERSFLEELARSTKEVETKKLYLRRSYDCKKGLGGG